MTSNIPINGYIYIYAIHIYSYIANGATTAYIYIYIYIYTFIIKEIKTSSGLYWNWVAQYNPEEALISIMINMNPGCPQFSEIYIYIKDYCITGRANVIFCAVGLR